MALIIEDRVAESSTTTGTGAFTLAGALTGFRSFSSVCSTNDTTYYMIEAIDGSGVPTGDWETGLGTYSAANTLTRTTVHDSSNSGAAVNFSAGTKRVMLSPTAAYLNSGSTAFSGASVYNGSSVGLTSGASTLFNDWDTVEFDVGGWFNAANEDRLTVPAGVSYAAASASINRGSQTDQLVVYIYIRNSGGTIMRQWINEVDTTGGDTTTVTTGPYPVSEGDYFQVTYFATNGGTVSSDTSSHFTAWAVSTHTNPAEGSAFPSNPSDGDRFYRTDRNIEYFYDATNTRWLSTSLQKMVPDSNQVSTLPATFSSGTVNALGHFGHPSWDYDVYVERVTVSGRCTGTGGEFDIVYDFVDETGSSIGTYTLEYDYTGTVDPNNEVASVGVVWPKQGRGSWYMNRNSGTYFGYPVGMIEYRLIG